MNQTGPHIAIVEGEFLIAFDAEYLIRNTLDCRISLVRPDQFSGWTERDLATLDLCLIDVPLQAAEATNAALRLRRLGVPFFFTTVSEFHRRGLESFDGIPVVMKPYDGDILLAAVRKVMPDASDRQN